MAKKQDIVTPEGASGAVVERPPQVAAPARELRLRTVLTATREPAEPLVEMGGYRLPPGATVLREAEPNEDGTQPEGTVPPAVFADLLRYHMDRYVEPKDLEPKAVEAAKVGVSDGTEG